MTSATTLKQSFTVAFIVVFAGLMIAASVGAATSGTVAATVTPLLVSVSVSDGNVAYGVLDANVTANTITSGDLQTVTNGGNVNVNLGIKSSDAVSDGIDWNLAVAAGEDAFTHEFSTDGSSWTAFNVDNTTYSSLGASVSPSGTETFDLQIGTPTSSSNVLEHTITVTVLATAS